MKSDVSGLQTALASIAATGGRPKGVFTTKDVCREADCGLDKALRILHQFADDPGLELVKFGCTALNGSKRKAVGYRLRRAK